ncbi:MAG: transporter, family, hexuronate transporter [Blastocatellia bacterium]|jgi:ACS family hexuronate transporter-like MFS transporter|nr:transporter, family, hexuronate transporter [Blastocatellia bacterium]
MLDASPIEATATEGGFKLRGLRWWIISLIFLATLINYIDRLTISVLAPVITRDLHLSNTEFGGILTWFLFAYTISQGLSGKLYDRIGTKRGFVCSILLWSLAAMSHAFARGLASLSVFRFILGFGEAGNWPGAAKTVAEWFPIRERAFGMAIFNSGAAIGSVVAPPLIVWLSLTYGWQTTFIVTGSLGFAWLVLWLLFYQTPDRHKWLGAAERQLILEGQRVDATADAKVIEPAAPLGWRELLRYRQVWAIVLARFLTDPVWWLYISWLPKYLADARGFSLVKIGLFAWVPYVAADAGSLSGGWLSGYLISRGWSVDRSRKLVILIAALLMPAGIFAAFANNAMVALVLIGVVLFGFQVWINNVQTLPSDFFSDKAVASVAGLGGTGAGIGSMIFIFSTGWIVDHFSYVPVLVAAGLLAPFGTVVLFALSGPIKRVSLKPSLVFS